MPPLPKDPSTRRRRNRTAGARVLTLVKTPQEVPELPSIRQWNAMTLAWWRDFWHDPMSAEVLPSDRHRLVMLAVLVDDYWNEKTTVSQRLALLSEIRLTGALFGTSPIDRRRLQWEIDRGEEAEANTARRREEKSSSSSTKGKGKGKTKPADPRLALVQ